MLSYVSPIPAYPNCIQYTLPTIYEISCAWLILPPKKRVQHALVRFWLSKKQKAEHWMITPSLFYFLFLQITSLLLWTFCKKPYFVVVHIDVWCCCERSRQQPISYSLTLALLLAGGSSLFTLAIEACALCFRTAAGIASGDPDLFCLALAALVKAAVFCMAAYAGFWSCGSRGVGHALRPFPEAVATGLIRFWSVLSAHHDIALRAKLFFIIHAIFHGTF